MAIKISTITDLETRTAFADEDRMLLSVFDQPIAGQWESRAVEGTVLKSVFGSTTKTSIEAAQILQLGTVPVLLTAESFATVNKYVIPEGFLIQLVYSGDKYEGNVAVEIGYTNGSVFAAADGIRTTENLLDATSNQLYIGAADLIKDRTKGIKQDLNIGIQATGGTQPTTGTSTLNIWTKYRIVLV